MPKYIRVKYDRRKKCIQRSMISTVVVLSLDLCLMYDRSALKVGFGWPGLLPGGPTYTFK